MIWNPIINRLNQAFYTILIIRKGITLIKLISNPFGNKDIYLNSIDSDRFTFGKEAKQYEVTIQQKYK